MRVAVVLIAVVGAVAALIYFATREAGPDQATLARILGGQGECSRLVADFTRTGVFKRVVRETPASAFVYVDGASWDRQTTSDRLNQTLSAYCGLTPPNGYFTVTVRNMDGENVFRVQNGRLVPWF
jgi:hypothetical protein